jgi:hypothetical protein
VLEPFDPVELLVLLEPVELLLTVVAAPPMGVVGVVLSQMGASELPKRSTKCSCPKNKRASTRMSAVVGYPEEIWNAGEQTGIS